MPRPIVGDIFMLQELFRSFFLCCEKAPGRAVCATQRKERMIYKHNKAAQNRKFYVAAFTTNRHVTRRRRFACVSHFDVDSLSHFWCFIEVSHTGVVYYFFDFFLLPGRARCTRRRTNNTKHSDSFGEKERHI
jgi:hypothetical protein